RCTENDRALAGQRSRPRPLLGALPVFDGSACTRRMRTPRSAIPLAERILRFRVAAIATRRYLLASYPRVESVIAPFDLGILGHWLKLACRSCHAASPGSGSRLCHVRCAQLEPARR